MMGGEKKWDYFRTVEKRPVMSARCSILSCAAIGWRAGKAAHSHGAAQSSLEGPSPPKTTATMSLRAGTPPPAARIDI